MPKIELEAGRRSDLKKDILVRGKERRGKALEHTRLSSFLLVLRAQSYQSSVTQG